MPGLGIYDKAKVLKRTEMVSQDDQWFIGDFCLVTVPRLVLGHGAQVNAGSKLLGRESIVLGDYSVIGYDCLLMTSTDRPLRALANDFIPEEDREILSESIVLGSHAFIGSKSTLMPGCKIPEGCVVGQGSVVTCIESLAMKPWTVYFADGSERPREVSP